MLISKRIFQLLLFGLVLIPLGNIYPHCDGFDGPVVKAAIKAIETNNVNLALVWVQKEDENTIRDLFDKVLSVRKLNHEARDLADLYFYETLVRIHRAGEGEPYTGLKEAGRDLGPVITAADLSIEKGKLEPIHKVFKHKNLSTAKIEKLFNEVVEKKNYKTDDVVSGRKYVAAYVEFLHTAEHLYNSSGKQDIEHKHGSEESKLHHTN